MRKMLERSFVVDATADEAWRRLCDLDDWPTWASFMRRVEVSPPGPAGPNTIATIVMTNHTRARVAMTEFVDGHRFRWEGSFLWLRLGYDHIIDPLDDGRARVSFVVDGGGVGVGTIGRLFAWAYARNLDRAIPVFRRLVESMTASAIR